MARPVSRRFIGREAELSLLMGAFTDTLAKTPGAVLVGAEAGGGKTRLVQEFASLVEGKARLLQGNCVELAEAGLPFGPFIAALRNLLRDSEAMGSSSAAHDARELWSLLAEPAREEDDADPEWRRVRIFEFILRVLEGIAEQQPLVLVIEDIHWADASTRDFLCFLVANLQSSAILLLVTFRVDAISRAHPMRSLLAELGRLNGVTRLTLNRLSQREVALQLEGILGSAPEPATVKRVYDQSLGVPLFTEAMVGRDGAIRAGPSGSIRDLLLGTIKDTPTSTQLVLRAASVGGARVGHGLLASVTGLDHGELIEALRCAVDSNILVHEADDYAFRHALIRQAVEQDLIAGERTALHRRFAEALEQGVAPSQDIWASLRLALHWAGAGEPEQALRAAWFAAGEAGERLAFEERLMMLQQVINLWGEAPGAAGKTGVDRSGLLERAADAACWAGEADLGLTYIEEALIELGPEASGRRANLLRERASLRQQALLSGEMDDLTESLRLAPEPGRLRLEILGQLARTLLLHDEQEEAEAVIDEMSIMSAALDDREYAAEAAMMRAYAQHGEDSLAAHRNGLEAAREAGSGRVEILAYAGLIQALDRCGRQVDAIRAGHEALSRAIQLGQGRYRGALIAQSLAQSLIAAGRFEEAVETIDNALDLVPAPFGRAQLLLARAEIALARGELELAGQILAELRSLPSAFRLERRRGAALAALEIEHELALGEPAKAIERANEYLGQAGDLTASAWPFLLAAARAFVEADNLDRDQGALSRLGEAASRLPVRDPLEVALSLNFSAELDHALGRATLAQWDAVAEKWETLGRPYPTVLALMRGAAAAASCGQRNIAGGRLHQAADAASRLDAEPLKERLHHLAKRMRVRLDPLQSAPVPQADNELTPREREVLKLLVAGYSNREIASELFIAVKTASVHVSNILGKLGVPTRGAAVAAAHRSGL
jgi:ATP/maltotriose-dependent transcriptional regulator MalT